jgi:hypothetical protein
LAWWYSCWKEYPHLYQLAQDILSIPGQYTFSSLRCFRSWWLSRLSCGCWANLFQWQRYSIDAAI